MSNLVLELRAIHAEAVTKHQHVAGREIKHTPWSRAADALDLKDVQIAEWKQAAALEAGLRREFLARAEAAESEIGTLRELLERAT